MLRSILAAVAVAFPLISGATGQQLLGGPRGQALPGGPGGPSEAPRFLVLAKNASLPANLPGKLEDEGAVILHAMPQIGAVVVQADEDFPARGKKLKQVQSVVPDIEVSWIDPWVVVPAFPYGLFGNPPASEDDDALFDLQWGHDAVDAPEAWAAGARGAGVRVAVLDDGIDSDHPDIAPNLNLELSTSFIDGEPFEYVENFKGDALSHGTHVAGTILAADNGIGTIGIAPEAELVMVKVLSSFTGSGSFSALGAGIVYAADIGADVVNMSLGANFERSGFFIGETWISASDVAGLKTFMHRATNYAHQQGVTLIASAGNDAIDHDKAADFLSLPMDAPHVLAISATAPVGWATGSEDLDEPAYYTDHGQSAIAFAAPGGSVVLPGEDLCEIAGQPRPCWVFDMVFSTGSAGGYYWAIGTSMAAPHAAGAAALVIGAHGGDLAPSQVKTALRQGADDLGKPGQDDWYGHGRVNAYKSLP